MAEFIPAYLGTNTPDPATEATLALIKLNTDKLDVPLSEVADAATGLTDAELRATPVPVSGTVTANAGTGTMAVSAASLPLPSGASTAAKQPALGSAGTASSDVITIQGVASMTPVKTDGSGVTQPVSGTVTATIPNLDVALSTRTKPADQQHAIIDSGTLTNLSQQGGVAISLNTGVRDAGTQRVTIATNDSVPVTGTFWQATQPVSIATAPALVASSAIIGNIRIDQTTPGTTNAVQVVGGAADATNAVIAIAQKPIAASTYSPSLFQNLAADVTKNVKSSAGNVFSVSCYQSNALPRYLQLHNTATVPSAAAVPVFSFSVPSLAQIVIGTDFFTEMGAHFSTGIAFAFSTTIHQYTAGSAGDQITFVQYK